MFQKRPKSRFFWRAFPHQNSIYWRRRRLLKSFKVSHPKMDVSYCTKWGHFWSAGPHFVQLFPIILKIRPTRETPRSTPEYDNNCFVFCQVYLDHLLQLMYSYLNDNYPFFMCSQKNFEDLIFSPSTFIS